MFTNGVVFVLVIVCCDAIADISNWYNGPNEQINDNILNTNGHTSITLKYLLLLLLLLLLSLYSVQRVTSNHVSLRRRYIHYV